MNYYGVTRSTDHLAHYGVKGMRWGVRRAIATGNARALNRHYRKAAKKLAKLQDIGNHSVKYGAKAAGYGAAAATTGAMAIGGTKTASNIARLIGNKIPFKSGKIISNIPAGNAYAQKIAADMVRGKAAKAIKAREAAYNSITKWGSKTHNLDPMISGSRNMSKKVSNFLNLDPTGEKAVSSATNNLTKAIKNKPKAKTVSNNTLFRIGAGAVTAGLAAKAAQNAYRAKHGEKYRDKATAFKEAMDETFAGTPYEGHYEKVRRRRRR